MKLLYFASSSYGGLLIYAQDQANALAELGIEVTVLCSDRFEKRPGDAYTTLPLLVDNRPNGARSRVGRTLHFSKILFSNQAILEQTILSGGYDSVLLVAYAEYLSPFWAHRFRKLRRRGVRFGAIIQEAVRDFQVGPRWWHNWSVRCAYDYLSYAFVHDEIDLDTGAPMPELETIVVPMAPHAFPEPSETPLRTRERLGIPADRTLLLAFGHIRDNKNLDYAIHALKEVPGSHLLVAGARNSQSQKPESFYRELAESLGVADRCTWLFDYVSDEEAANLFNTCDLVLLTYSTAFHSASGVLNVSARYRKPCIASAGAGSLQNVVKEYGLGVWVEPDQKPAVAEGIRQWLSNPPHPRWEQYGRDNSWQRSAERVARAFGLTPSKRSVPDAAPARSATATGKLRIS